MKLPGWSWLVVGILVSAMSGYIYLTIPKNGEPNNAMALFFFIGILFLAIGLFKLFFREKDEESMITSPEHIIQSGQKTSLNQQTTSQAKQQMHTNVYAKDHPYVHHVNQPQNTQAQQNMSHHTQNRIHHASSNQPLHHTHSVHQTGHSLHQGHIHQSHNATQAHQNSSCPKCGVRSFGTNFCHNCGTRLK